jgi:hypothetical protein
MLDSGTEFTFKILMASLQTEYKLVCIIFPFTKRGG